MDLVIEYQRTNIRSEQYMIKFTNDPNRRFIIMDRYLNPGIKDGRPLVLRFQGFARYTDDELLYIFNYIEELYKSKMLFDDVTYDKLYFARISIDDGCKRYYTLTGKDYIGL